MTRTVEEYADLFAALNEALLDGDISASPAFCDLRQEMIDEGILDQVVEILRRGTGPMHVHVSPQEEGS